MARLVSVVIPTYARPSFLRRAVQSVIEQTYTPIELIVVDDGSPDPIQPVVDELDTDVLHRVEVIRHRENRGGNAARNTGIEAASGEIIAFLDDDDRWRPAAVSRYVEQFEVGGSDVGVVAVGVQVVDGSGEELAILRPVLEGDPMEALLEGSLVGSFSRFAVRADVVDTVGLPDERMPCWQDWDWQFRLARQTDFVGIPDLLVVRTHGPHRQVTDIFEQRRDIAYPLMLDRHLDAIGAEHGHQGKRRFIAVLSRSLAASALNNGRYLAAIRYLLRSLRHDPFASRTYLYLGAACGGPLTYRTARRLKRRAGWTG